MPTSELALCDLYSCKLPNGLGERYDILGKIEHSGSSQLYRVVCKRGRLKDRNMVLKTSSTLFDPLGSTHGAYRIHQSLHHPNIVSLFEVEQETCIMELCLHGNLSDYAQRFPCSLLDEPTVIALLRNISSALDYLKSKNVLHRGIEPQNVLVSSIGTFKLTNFAEACYNHEWDRDRHGYQSSRYCAPELVAGRPHSFPADAWSLGCLLLAMSLGPQFLERLPDTPKVTDLLPPTLQSTIVGGAISGFLQIEPAKRAIPSDFKQCRRPDVRCKHPPNTDHNSREWEFELEPSSALLIEELIDSSNGDGPKKKPGLNDPCRRPSELPPSSLVQRSATMPALTSQSLGWKGLGSRRTASDSRIDQDRFARFFQTPASRLNFKLREDCANANQEATHHGPSDRPSSCIETSDLCILSPGDYKFHHGLLTVLSSRSILVDVLQEHQEVRKDEPEVLLIDLKDETVSIYPASSRPTLASHRTAIPKTQFTLAELPDDYRVVYRDILGHLEELKEKTPMLVLHLVEGKCTMMCNTPVPDIEVILRSSVSPSPSSRTLLRVRLLRRSQHLEISRRTSQDLSSIWVKRQLPCTGDFPFLSVEDWDALDDIERRALRLLDNFLPVCTSALELGSLRIKRDVGSTLKEKIVDSTCEFTVSDFTPHFLPDLASSLPPRPLKFSAGRDWNLKSK